MTYCVDRLDPNLPLSDTALGSADHDLPLSDAAQDLCCAVSTQETSAR